MLFIAFCDSGSDELGLACHSNCKALICCECLWFRLPLVHCTLVCLRTSQREIHSCLLALCTAFAFRVSRKCTNWRTCAPFDWVLWKAGVQSTVARLSPVHLAGLKYTWRGPWSGWTRSWLKWALCLQEVLQAKFIDFSYFVPIYLGLLWFILSLFLYSWCKWKVLNLRALYVSLICLRNPWLVVCCRYFVF